MRSMIKDSARNVRSIKLVVASVLCTAALATQAMADVPKPLSIPAGDLLAAIEAIARQSDEQLVYQPAELKGKQTVGVNGTLSTADALKKVLEGTPFRLRVDAETGAMLIAPAERNDPPAVSRGPTPRKVQIDAPAAQKADVQATRLEEVLVVSRRREERLMETPVSVTAFSATELADRQIDQSNQIAASTPNMVFRNAVGKSNVGAAVFIRGIGQQDYVPTVQPGVGTYVDGAYVSGIIGALTNVVDIESIEVLRGPQGTLFGRNTIGGAVLINTKKPNNEWAGDVQATFGDFNLQQYKGSINIPVSSNFFVKLSAMKRERDGYVKTPLVPASNGFGSDDTIAGRIAMRWEPTDALTFDLAVDRSHHESWGVPAVLAGLNPTRGHPGTYNTRVAPALGLEPITDAYVQPEGSYTSLATALEKGEVDVFGGTLTAEWDFADNMSLKSITNYRKMESVDTQDTDSSPFRISHVGDVFDGHQSSQELHLSGRSFQERLHWLTGVYYFQEEVVNYNPTMQPTVSLISGAVVKNKSSAVFGQLTYKVTDKASVTLGGRYTDEQRDSIVDERTQYITEVFDATVPGAYREIPPDTLRIQPVNLFEADESQLEPYLNLSYQWTLDFMTYVSYAEGFKGGGFTQRISPGGRTSAFSPEFAKTYELGVKWLGFNNRLRLTGAAFYTDYQDLQVVVSRATGSTTDNAGDAILKGFELEIVASPLSWLQLSGGVGHLDGKYTRLDPGVTTFNIDSRLPSVIDWQANASATVHIPAPALSGEIRVRGDWSYTDDYFVEASNSPGTLQEARSIYNAAITYVHESQKWELAIQGKNLADKWYHEASRYNLESNGWIIHYMSPPREISARLLYRW